MREYIDGAALRDMMLVAADALNRNKQQINELNVFPVPDGDTGTNMSLTIGAASTELKKDGSGTIGTIAERVASAMLRGARGNSGVILSLLFRGMSKTLRGVEQADAVQIASAMGDGVDAAYKAVMKPAEGTILTVSRVATRAAAEFAESSADIEQMFIHMLDAAEQALAETMEINPVLKKAGVIDAGGRGYVIILESMLAWIQGRTVLLLEDFEAREADFTAFEVTDITFTYCTEFIVSKDALGDVAKLRVFLDNYGDSIVVVDDDEIIKVHVHTNDPGVVLTEALTYGSLLTVKVENMREQHTQLNNTDPSDKASDTPLNGTHKKYGVVTIAAGEGLKKLFLELGADSIVNGGQTMNPSTEDILQEVERTSADIVYVLPNNKNIIMAVEQCIPLTEKKVVVIPTTTVPQGISAMLALDTEQDEETCTNALLNAIQTVHTALITYAARDSGFDGYDIRQGEYLALLENALIGSYDRPDSLIEGVCEAFRDSDPEFISVYYGEDVAPEEAQTTVEIISRNFKDAEVSLIDGGQPVYYYMISAE